MPFDALALHAIADELRASMLEGRVQKALFVDEHSIALEIYAQRERRWLLASTHPEAARVHLVGEPQARGTDRVTPFLLLVRKHVRDARLVAIEQEPLERVLELRFAHRESSGLRQITLVMELMGRRSNMVLVDEDGAVLDALKRVSRQANPTRPILPHGRYEPPPRPDRLDPRRATSYFALEERVAQGAAERTLAQLLVAHLAGLSPFAAEELAYRATGEHRAPFAPDAPLPWTALRRAAEELLAPLEMHAWDPHLVLRDDQPADAVPYRPQQLDAAELEPTPSTSAAFERLYASGTPRALAQRQFGAERGPHALLRAPLLAALADRRAQTERKIAALERSLEGSERAEALRAAGDVILANLAAIAPGQTALAGDGQQVVLDPTLTPVENAQRYFEDYTRARDAGRIVPDLVAAARNELRYVDEMRAQIELAGEPGALEQLRRELVAQGMLAPSRGETKRGRAAPPRGGHRRLQVDGFDVLVGASALGNERVTFELAGNDDVWLHARGVPGSHVIVRSRGRALPVEVVEAAARLAAEHSASRHDALVLVDWTPRKYVRKIRGAPPGLVTYTHEQTLRVRPGTAAAAD
ncbi:MAG TPA: NFACT family protein [Chloroflexota bacterium]|jgi:predicted ribosome quality control (RQC) complex YloA/Tae2 family protein